MGVNYFSNQQVLQLRNNKYVKRVSTKAVTYTTELKIEIHKLISDGLTPSQALNQLGFDTKALGASRIRNLGVVVRRDFDRLEGYQDTRTIKSGRKTTKPMSTEQLLAYKDKQILRLTQELEFAKKNDMIEKQAIHKSKNKRQNKNSN